MIRRLRGWFSAAPVESLLSVEKLPDGVPWSPVARSGSRHGPVNDFK